MFPTRKFYCSPISTLVSASMMCCFIFSSSVFCKRNDQNDHTILFTAYKRQGFSPFKINPNTKSVLHNSSIRRASQFFKALFILHIKCINCCRESDNLLVLWQNSNLFFLSCSRRQLYMNVLFDPCVRWVFIPKTILQFQIHLIKWM